jgi:L-serine dehydratase
VTLFGSLAATGKGHLTDTALREAFGHTRIDIRWKPDEHLPLHPNGMLFESFTANGELVSSGIFYSVGGGALLCESDPEQAKSVYELSAMNDIVAWSEDSGRPIWEYVLDCEGPEILTYLGEVWAVMRVAIDRGLRNQSVLPGSLKLQRKAASYFAKARLWSAELKRSGMLSAYALAVSEENAAGGTVVTAPTCGSSGVLPAVLRYMLESQNLSDQEIIRALATAGLIGNLVKTNGSISGAEVGCQGEVGTACAMAAGACAQLLGGTAPQIEYAAEIGMEHHLGLTCDPVAGLVQIPCIERNAFAATRAVDCAGYALLSDGRHRISFDDVVQTMKQTGMDLQQNYRETSGGGLAAVYKSQKESGFGI